MDTTNQLLKLQNIELDILKSFSQLCEKHNLTYFLVGGSCLGMVRHQGFIPWDDDIDLGMPRKDYEKFCEIAKKELPEDLVLQNFDTEPNCGLIFGKIRKKGTILSEDYSYQIPMSQGVWIDIFPYDFVPDDEKTRQRKYRKVLFYKNLYIVKSGYKNPHPESWMYRIAYGIAKMVVAPLSLHFLIKKIKKFMICKEETEYVFPYGGAYPKKDLFTKDLIEETVKMPFEQAKFRTFRQYDRYLKQLYGDYMVLPPVEKRTGGMHHIHEIDLDKK